MFKNTKKWFNALLASLDHIDFKTSMLKNFSSKNKVFIALWKNLENIDFSRNTTKNLMKISIQLPYIMASIISLVLYTIAKRFSIMAIKFIEQSLKLTVAIFNDVLGLGIDLVKKLAKALNINIIVDACDFLQRNLEKLFLSFIKAINLSPFVKLVFLDIFIDNIQKTTEFLLDYLHDIADGLSDVILEVVIDVPLNILEVGVSLTRNLYAKITTLFAADNQPKYDSSNDNPASQARASSDDSSDENLDNNNPTFTPAHNQKKNNNEGDFGLSVRKPQNQHINNDDGEEQQHQNNKRTERVSNFPIE